MATMIHLQFLWVGSSFKLIKHRSEMGTAFRYEFLYDPYDQLNYDLIKITIEEFFFMTNLLSWLHFDTWEMIDVNCVDNFSAIEESVYLVDSVKVSISHKASPQICADWIISSGIVKENLLYTRNWTLSRPIANTYNVYLWQPNIRWHLKL